ncbi:porphobilinogen synthase [[Eubacterium] cellulosolvens]
MFPESRLRRLRKPQMRKLVRETLLDSSDFIYPIFIKEGIDSPEPIKAMPGQFQIPLNNTVNEAENLISLGIPGAILFGIPIEKDETGSSAYNNKGIIQKAIRKIKEKAKNDLVVITDICLCQYTTHGHCGIIKDNEVLNDPTLEIMQKIAVSHAEAGADIVAPSAMMDGQVKAIRKALDKSGFSDVAIMAYSAKHASNFYGPFREAAESAPSFGDRRSYQMDFSNANEALREVRLDIEEGADIVMVKPALAYLDLIHRIKNEFKLPTAAYNVSGEYSMIKAAAKNGWINEKAIIIEVLTAIKRAGADIILTYFAKDVAGWLKRNEEI